MILLALPIILLRRLFGEFIPIIEEAPTVAELLARAAPVVARFIGGLLAFLQQESLQDSIESLQNQLNSFVNAWQLVTDAIVQTDDHEAQAVMNASVLMDQTGGGIEQIGHNQWSMWSRLRYNLMPRTIQYIWNFVWSAWIQPLRAGLIRTIIWAQRWHAWLQVFVIDIRAYTRQIQVWGRTWRATYVYPQLLFLLNPWRVAYWYVQAFLTAIVQYLNYEGHAQDRDGVSRVVYSCMGRLWQSFDRHLAEWLLTDISSYGWGSSLPTFPPGADATPPRKPPDVWEPFVPEPVEPAAPPWVPDIPGVDWIY